MTRYTSGNPAEKYERYKRYVFLNSLYIGINIFSNQNNVPSVPFVPKLPRPPPSVQMDLKGSNESR